MNRVGYTDRDPRPRTHDCRARHMLRSERARGLGRTCGTKCTPVHLTQARIARELPLVLSTSLFSKSCVAGRASCSLPTCALWADPCAPAAASATRSPLWVNDASDATTTTRRSLGSRMDARAAASARSPTRARANRSPQTRGRRSAAPTRPAQGLKPSSKRSRRQPQNPKTPKSLSDIIFYKWTLLLLGNKHSKANEVRMSSNKN